MAVSIKQLNPTYGFDHRSDFCNIYRFWKGSLVYCARRRVQASNRRFAAALGESQRARRVKQQSGGLFAAKAGSKPCLQPGPQAVSKADGGIDNPSAPAGHLPLHRGGFGAVQKRI